MKHLILNQLGTPQSPSADDVGEYLNEFLMDPYIIGLPRPLLDILVKVIIVPRRKYKSSEKYKKVWTPQGSPLAINTENLRLKIQTYLGDEWQVHTGMRYGKPSIKSVLENLSLQTNDQIYFCPLYPQYADATVGSAVAILNQDLDQLKITNSVKITKPFYNQEWYIKSLALIIKSQLKTEDHLLLSYHGIPVAQEKKSQFSYYDNCLKTSELLQKELNLNSNQMSTSFQSRVGLAKWLEPSTEETALKLARSGVTHLKVACPSFVADCLETIEEIGLDLKHQYLSSGGKSFELISCLNDNNYFASQLAEYIKK